jgi:hypothetical protein
MFERLKITPTLVSVLVLASTVTVLLVRLSRVTLTCSSGVVLVVVDTVVVSKTVADTVAMLLTSVVRMVPVMTVSVLRIVVRDSRVVGMVMRVVVVANWPCFLTTSTIL